MKARLISKLVTQITRIYIIKTMQLITLWDQLNYMPTRRSSQITCCRIRIRIPFCHRPRKTIILILSIRRTITFQSSKRIVKSTGASWARSMAFGIRLDQASLARRSEVTRRVAATGFTRISFVKKVSIRRARSKWNGSKSIFHCICKTSTRTRTRTTHPVTVKMNWMKICWRRSRKLITPFKASKTKRILNKRKIRKYSNQCAPWLLYAVILAAAVRITSKRKHFWKTNWTIKKMSTNTGDSCSNKTKSKTKYFRIFRPLNHLMTNSSLKGK